MATTEFNPLTTKFHGHIGGIIFYVVRNKQRMRSTPSLVHNPRSIRQTAHRTRFAAANSLAATFKAIYPIGYNNANTDLDPRSAFVKHIYHTALDNDALLYPHRLQISQGTLTPFQASSVATDNLRLNLRWSLSLGSPSDRLCVCLYNYTRSSAHSSPNIASRTDRTVQIHIPSDWQDDHIFVYCFWHNPDSHAVSTSVIAAELNTPDTPDSANQDLLIHLNSFSLPWKPAIRKHYIKSISQSLTSSPNTPYTITNNSVL